MELLKKIAHILIDFIFPPTKEEALITSLALEDLQKGTQALQSDRRLPGSLILFEYHNTLVRTLILALKENGNKKACSLLAEALYDRLIEELADKNIMQGFTKPLLIPIPVSKKTRSLRGWNQCELLCRELCVLDGNQNMELCLHTLIKHRHTSDQVGKSKTERSTNLKDCFSIQKPERIQGRNIIVLDDVVTTGATISEAKRTLLQAGAKKVFIVAVAH